VARARFNALDGINIRMISQGASLLNLSFVVAESRSARRRRSAAPRILPSSTQRVRAARCISDAADLAIVGYGKMGRMIERLAPDTDFIVALKLDEFNNANFEGSDGGEFSRYRRGDRFFHSLGRAGNIERIAALGVNLVIGTTGWLDNGARQKRRRNTASGWSGAPIIRSA
jgi:hypothetical protein